MNGTHGIAETRKHITAARREGLTVGFVPTMGALHEGHRSLIRAAREECDLVVVSIFVNPTQFGPQEDFSRYPRPLEDDLAACREEGVDLVFHPTVEEMYPEAAATDGGLTTVEVRKLAGTLCGRTRPGHFPGVCTVVTKLLNIVQPDRAYFGRKDYQQAVIIRRMVADLNIPTDIVFCPIVREADGLALSSRNAYLSEEHRRQAVALHGALQKAAALIRSRHPQAGEVLAGCLEHLCNHAPDGEVDYVQIVDPESLEDLERTDRPVVIALAVRFEGARLIDNILVD